MTRPVWGWVAVSFHDPDSDDVVVRGMKICTNQTSDWRWFTQHPDVISGAIEEFEDATLCFASPYIQEGDLLSLRVDELPREEWENAESWWYNYFNGLGFKVTNWQELPNDGGIRPHLTPDDQIRADELEELLEFLR